MEGRSVLQWDKDDCAAAGPREVRPARPRHAHDAAPRGRPRARARRRRRRSRHDPAGERGLRPVVRGRHRRRVPGGEPRADGHAAAAAARATSTTSWWRSRSSGPARSRAARCTRTSGAATARRRSRTSTRSPSRACEKTLGVPLFQEQLMQLAVDCAGFSAAEADQLRQAMGSKRIAGAHGPHARTADGGHGRTRHHRRDRRGDLHEAARRSRASASPRATR